MEKQSLDKAIQPLSKQIYAFCRRRTSNSYDADDLEQEILLELYRSAGNLRDEQAFFGFVWSISEHVYNQWYKKRLREQNKTIPLTETLSDSLPDDLAETESDSEMILLLRRELAFLHTEYRRAAILYYLDNRTCKEIAQILDIGESMVKYLLFQARKKLKEGIYMERTFGKHSYQPTTLQPYYLGEGPNRFHEFLSGRLILQNILSACYNDSLSAQEISMETGIPMPYLEGEIDALTAKNCLIKTGKRYMTNVIIVDADCMDEMSRAVQPTLDTLTAAIKAFMDAHLPQFRALAFPGADCSENTLRWRLAAIVLRAVMGLEDLPLTETAAGPVEPPQTAWGEHAYTWLMEKVPDAACSLCFCCLSGKYGDHLRFLDDLKNGKGSHADFFNYPRKVNILCDIAHHTTAAFSEYDMEILAELVRDDYVYHTGKGYACTLPIYTTEQYRTILSWIQNTLCPQTESIFHAQDTAVKQILENHTPKHLAEQVPGIAAILSQDLFHGTAPASALITDGYLTTNWHPNEMPTCYLILGA